MLSSLRDLFGVAIMATDGHIGRVHDFYFDDQHWTVRYMVVDTGGWLNGRLVLISPVALKAPDWYARTFPVSLTRQQVEDSPSILSDMPVSRQHEIQLHKHYGWPMYWGGGMVTGEILAFYPELITQSEMSDKDPSEEDAARSEGGDPHLRSVREVTGYHVRATDGEIGHVDDFLVDDESWRIHYIVADTHNLLPGKRVLLSPRWIEQVNWDESKVHVIVSRRKVKAAPEYHSGVTVDRRHEEALYDHYFREHRRAASERRLGARNKAVRTGSKEQIRSGPASISSLVADLASEDEVQRTDARQSLVAIGRPAVAPLTEALGDSRRQVRWEAAKALCEIADPAAAPALVKTLQDSEFSIRWLASEGLIALGPRGLEPLLRALMEHSDSVWLRQGAHHVLHDLARGILKEVLQPVLAALEDIEPSLEAPLAARTALDTLTEATWASTGTR